MPPRKEAKAPKQEKSKARKTISQIQKVNVRVGGGGGGVGSSPAPIVFATYTPPPVRLLHIPLSLCSTTALPRRLSSDLQLLTA
jgi:hypothetical protein